MKEIKMENLTDILTDFILTVVSGSFVLLGLDSLPGDQTLIKVVLSPAAETGLDITNKLMLLFSTFIASLSGGITIYKACKSFFR